MAYLLPGARYLLPAACGLRPAACSPQARALTSPSLPLGGRYVKGWNTNKTEWVPPHRREVADSVDVVANDLDWPSVEWPHYEGSQV